MEKDAFRKAVLVAEKSDSSDIFIGEVLGITFRKLEHFIAEACEASVSYIQVSPVYRLLETKEAPEGNNDCLELSPSRGLSHTPWGILEELVLLCSHNVVLKRLETGILCLIAS